MYSSIKFYILDIVTDATEWYVRYKLNPVPMGEQFMISVEDNLSLSMRREQLADYEIRNNTRDKMVAITVDDYYKLLSIHNFFIYDSDEEESDEERDHYISLLSKDFSEDFSNNAYFTYFQDVDFYKIYRTYIESGWIELTRDQYVDMKRDIDTAKLKEIADTVSKRDFIKDIMDRYEEVCKKSEIIKQEDIEEEKRKEEEREETKKMVEAQHLKQIEEDCRKQEELERIEELTHITITNESAGILRKNILKLCKSLHIIFSHTKIIGEGVQVKDIKKTVPTKPSKKIVVYTKSTDAIINEIDNPNIKEFLRKNSFMRNWYTLRMTQINEKKYTKTLMEKTRGSSRK